MAHACAKESTKRCM